MTGSRRFWKIKTLPVEVEVEEEEEGSVRVQRGQSTARVFPDRPIWITIISLLVTDTYHLLTLRLGSSPPRSQAQ